MKKIKKILIANRGEIAIRILRSCRELGIQTVSIHSTEDENSLHVKLADESVCIGPAKATQSYLNMPAVLSAVEITEADAVHPGFGFLSENVEFVKMCEKCNVTFIGPNSQNIHQMGDKILSKEIAKKSGVPILESIPVKTIDQQLENQVESLGYPVIVKASAGGGGKGMKKVLKSEDLAPTIKLMQKESLNAFNSDEVFIEKFIDNARHIEVQILADGKTFLHLGERDCSIQKKYQKIIEESPSCVISEEKRQEILEAALRIARETEYNSVGTVEFLYDQNSGGFFFIEMNTRIQVEHPVTEQRAGIDLIAEQIKIASGIPLEYRQEDLPLKGHAIECRINATSLASKNGKPGEITFYYRPGGIGIRVDDYIYTGYQVSPHYDSMLAKIIAYAPTRMECIKRMQRALDEIIIEGIQTNLETHRKIFKDENFREDRFNTLSFAKT